MAVLIFVAAGWGGAQWTAEGKTASLQSAGSSPVLYKNNLPAALTQELPPASPVPGKLQPQPDATSATPAISLVRNNSQATAKTVYLTFDDGPSKITSKVLEILRQQGVKATFFVLGEQAQSHPELINAIWEQGHAIGNHTYNHNYHDLYSGFTQFWSQIKQTEEIIRNITGVRPQLVRAPGGTSGHFDETYFRLLEQAGYSVMDWTADSGDSRSKGVPAADILKESVADLTASRVILLLHDGGGHEQSAGALPEIIERYKAAGYAFGMLDGEVQPVQFRVSANAGGAGRAQPSQAWIAANIIPNRELFTPGKTLALEVGLLETKLLPGEYSISDGQYMVPLRALVERLGGQVSWDAASRSAGIVWNGRTVEADTLRKQLIVTDADGRQQIRSADVQIIGSSVWVPLRAVLEAVGHPPLTAAVNAEERRVTAL
ncbi:polysaccharide deacetylase [Paenibacillus sp. S150]|uniref:polysaccharide deacetylase n=1 Tax=Paenibacillus sp. S150 TaxID=2749826 RepID=UPI001E5F3913|nr:polysaccharide deacetylase [Paenibacillus sp. S150]